MRGQEVPIHKL